MGKKILVRHPQSKLNMNSSLVYYTAPVLKKNKAGVYIEYSAMSPSGKLKRKKHYYNRYKGKELKMVTEQAIKELNRRLATGWSPHLDQEPSSYMIPIGEAIELYKLDYAKDHRKASLKTVHSMMAYYKGALTAGDQYRTCLEITPHFARQVMSNTYNSKNIKGVTFNSYLRNINAFANWCVQSGYMKSNPFKGIPSKRKTIKEREPIPELVIKKIETHFKEHSPGMFIVMKLVYHGLRPAEIARLKLNDIDTDQWVIKVSAQVSKTHKYRTYTIPKYLVPDLKEFIRGYPKTNWLVSNNHRPGSKKREPRYMGEAWHAMRKKVKIRAKYKLYSLRDTGIIDLLLRGISVKIIMDQYGHSSLEMTSIYAGYMPKLANREIANL